MKYRHALRNPAFLHTATGEKLPGGHQNGWQDRHLAAIRNPGPLEAGIVAMLHGWAEYADRHSDISSSSIGQDGVLGPQWRDIGRAIHALLNGETGRLDCGTLSTFIHDALRSEGF